ncbi:Sister chromatid cohesion protein [Mycena chlorophos]|uniref:Sister chromatid cohesion protein n=1 Tax=Mycena chlorophos TaxID=658473 RepID=A0A8H6RYS3_MYCCL|nr:Sister chromatid cohesion protein [Mycena chlorophos]
MSGPSWSAPHHNASGPASNEQSTVQSAHSLLAMYPFASANPSTHGKSPRFSARVAAPPSSLHPQYYATLPRGRPPPPYANYPPDARYLASRPANEHGYWEAARNEASSHILHQADPSYAPPTQWAPTNAQMSTYRPNPFAQAIMQRTNPAMAYPTPPPPSTSSSSLANALGFQQPQSNGVHQAQQSPAFFDNFIAQNETPAPAKVVKTHASKAATMPRMSAPPKPAIPTWPPAHSPLRAEPTIRAITPPPLARKPVVEESPDPLAILPSALTPRKRKSEAELYSPHLKRLNSPHTSSVPSVPVTPSSRPSLPSTPSTTPSRRITLNYTAVPPKPYTITPKSSHKLLSRPLDSPDDLGGYGSADIFEAEDASMPDTEIEALPIKFFLHKTTTDTTHPLLNPTLMRKLIKHIGKVAQPKRIRHSAGVGNTPRAAEKSLADLELAMILHILKMLARSVASRPARVLTRSLVHLLLRRPARHRRLSRSMTRKRRSKSLFGDEAEPELMQIEMLELVRDSVLATDAAERGVAGQADVLGGARHKLLERGQEPAYQNHLPVVEGLEASAGALVLLLHVMQNKFLFLGEIYRSITATIPRLTGLVNAETVAMSDTIIIHAVYIAIGPFFVVDPGEESGGKKEKDTPVIRTFGNTAMRALRLDALSLIRAIFANHDDQRDWIIEEILSSLIKLSDTKQKAGSFKLRDGRSIRTVSALLLQLVQTSAHDVRVKAADIAKERQTKIALKQQQSFTESQQSLQVEDEFLDEHDRAEIRLYKTGLESATKAAKTIIVFLTQRSGKTKATKNSNEAEYRAILDNFLSDMLVVLFWPEYPAASLILNIASRFMLTSLDDVRTAQTDNNAVKTMALDHLGVIAAQIRKSVLKCRGDGSKKRVLKPLDELASNLDSKGLDRLLTSHHDVAAHLSKRSSEEQAYDSARELSAATFGFELALALERLDISISHPDEDEDMTLQDPAQLKVIGKKIKSALHSVWKDQSGDVFDAGSEEDVPRIDQTAEAIGTIQTLKNSFTPILNVILGSLDAPPIFMRTKALRALGQIVTSDPTILGETNVRRAIESHFLDSSSAVRDAAVELIGKYMIDSPEVAGNYYTKIADRMADTGLAVRKRVIKLLKQYYGVISDIETKTDICRRLVMRMADEDDTIKELAIKTIEELWFPVVLLSAMKSRGSVSTGDVLQTKVAVIMGTSAHFTDRQSPLEDILHQIISGSEGLHKRYAEIYEVLIEALVDATDFPGFTVINCVRTIHLFTNAYPAVFSHDHATTLLPFLKAKPATDEQATNEYVLKIFRASIPHMPRTAVKFGQDLQAVLQPMIIQPASLPGLNDSVACMCTVVQSLTHEFDKLSALLKSCNGLIQKSLKTPPENMQKVGLIVVIAALVCEHTDIEKIRRENPDISSDLDSISTGPIVEAVFDSFVKLYGKYHDASFRIRLLSCLGCLYRAQPTLMTTERSAEIMDDIFQSNDEERRGRLLKMFQEFLMSEAEKHAAKQKDTAATAAKTKGKATATDVNMEELVGNTDGFADSGVSSAVVQRYMAHILDAALSRHPSIQAAATDVLTFTIKQGLAHPLQSFPVIVALENEPQLGAFRSCERPPRARASFDYQRRLDPNNVRGYRDGNALLGRWYALVKEKRQTRQEFLRLLAKVFKPQRPDEATQDEVDFLRYMAENFASFDYKTQEEVITVIKDLTTVLSLRGDAMDVDQQQEAAGVDRRPLMRASVGIGMIMLLKAYLKTCIPCPRTNARNSSWARRALSATRLRRENTTTPFLGIDSTFATEPILTSADCDAQKEQFLTIWNEDGVNAEPQDEFQ